MRFLKRLWALVHEHAESGLGTALEPTALAESARDLRRKTYETLARADDDYGRRWQFNTVVSAVMELCNAVSRFTPADEQERAVVTEALRIAVLVISPIAPHLTETLWRLLGGQGSLVGQPWPAMDTMALAQSTLELVVQVNGKVRGKIHVPADADQQTILIQAKAEDNVARHLQDKTIRKEIVVPNKLVNIVVS